MANLPVQLPQPSTSAACPTFCSRFKFRSDPSLERLHTYATANSYPHPTPDTQNPAPSQLDGGAAITDRFLSSLEQAHDAQASVAVG